MHRVLVALTLLSGCAYFDARAECSDACSQLLDDSGCAFDTSSISTSDGTTRLVCIESCARSEPVAQDEFVTCIQGNSCDALLDGVCNDDLEAVLDGLQ